MTRVAVVTGSNKGIGFAIVRALCSKFDGDVYLTARDVGRGEAAVAALQKEGLSPKFHQLDIDDSASIQTLKQFLETKYGGLDVLVNNAGMAYKMDSTAPFAEQAEVTMKTNFHSTLEMCDVLFPLLRSGARVVNVASMAGSMVFQRLSDNLKQKFKTTANRQGVVALMDKFVSDAKADKHTQEGWANSGYGTTKLGLIAANVYLQKEISQDSSRQGILVNCCCPGYVDTDMSSHKGHLTPDQGAVTPVYLALLPPGTTTPAGDFVKDLKIQNFL